MNIISCGVHSNMQMLPHIALVSSDNVSTFSMEPSFRLCMTAFEIIIKNPARFTIQIWWQGKMGSRYFRR
jgi:hypothetical protein